MGVMAAIPRRRELGRVTREVVDGFADHHLLTYASAIAYQLISAMIPFAFFALGLMGLLGLNDLWTNHLKPTIAGNASSEVFALIDKTVTQVLQHKQTFWVTFGLVLMLWELSGAMRATMEALDDIYGVRRKRSRKERYTTSVALSAAVGALFLIAVVALIGGNSVSGGVGSVFARYAVAAVMLTAAVGLTMRFAPGTSRPFRWIGGGSIVIVVGWLVTVGGYILYAGNVASYGSVFGSLAVVFVLIVVVYLSAVVFLVGVLVEKSAQDAAR
jgi:membrane protein